MPRGFGFSRTGDRPLVTWALLGANVLVFLAATAAGGTEDSEVLLNFGAMFGPLIASGEYWRLFTAMFLHVGFTHLFVNGFALFVFGPIVERAFGPTKFLTIYLLGGLTGSVASYLLNSIAIGAGASGGVFAVIGGLAAFFVVQRNALGSMGRRSLGGLLVLIGVNLSFGLAMPGIDNWAHIGGLAGGFALGMILAPTFRTVAAFPSVGPETVDENSLSRRLWVIPLWLGILTAGTWMAGASMPENPYTHVFVAERHFDRGNHVAALEEIEKALIPYDSVDPTQILLVRGDAHLLRGRILASQGAFDQAKAELGDAILYGDRLTRAQARELLVGLSLLR